MTTSAGSGITLRVDRYPFDTVNVGVGAEVDDVSRTGSASVRTCSVGEREWSDGLGGMFRST